MRGADALLPDGPTSGSDPQMEALMREHFGPELGERRETEEERAARGLAQVDALQSADGARIVRWLHQDLRAERPGLPPAVCFGCEAPGATSACAKCGVARYCSRECQLACWNRAHKAGCAALRSLGPSQRLTTADAVRTAADRLVSQLRLYLLPFAAQHGGPPRATLPTPPANNKTTVRHPPTGFVFLQSETSLDGLSLPTGRPPRDCSGRPLSQPRNVLMHFVTLQEFDAELVAALPAVAGARAALVEAMAGADGATEAVRGLHGHSMRPCCLPLCLQHIRSTRCDIPLFPLATRTTP
jgi:hypothetical protein